MLGRRDPASPYGSWPTPAPQAPAYSHGPEVPDDRGVRAGLVQGVHDGAGGGAGDGRRGARCRAGRGRHPAADVGRRRGLCRRDRGGDRRHVGSCRGARCARATDRGWVRVVASHPSRRDRNGVSRRARGHRTWATRGEALIDGGSGTPGPGGTGRRCSPPRDRVGRIGDERRRRRAPRGTGSGLPRRGWSGACARTG